MATVFYGGIWMDPFDLNRPDDLKIAASITRLGLSLADVPNITCFDTCEEILEAAIFSGATHAVITSAGAWVDWDWKQVTARWLDSQPAGAWLVAGHILDFTASGNWYWLHPQFFVVDLQSWQALGRPEFGAEIRDATHQQDLPICERSIDNVHDDYTPRWLHPGTGTTTHTGRLKLGWHMIKSALAAGMTVPNIPDEVRKLKGNTYPENPRWPNFVDQIKASMRRDDPVMTDPAVIDSAQLKYAKDLHARQWGGPRAVFVVNNETVDDVLSLPRQPIDHLICVAAGFKPNVLLLHCGFHEHTKITYVDHSRSTLEFKRYLQANWDGDDLMAAWQNWGADAAHLNGPGCDFNSYMDRMRAYLNITRDEWLEHWSRYRQLDVEYLHCDIITEQQRVLDMVEQVHCQHTLIWISNVLYTWPSMVRLDVCDNLGSEDWHFCMEDRLRQISRQQNRKVTSLGFRKADIKCHTGDADQLEILSHALIAKDDYDYHKACLDAVAAAEMACPDDAIGAGRMIHNSGLPWLRLDWQVPHAEMLGEAQALHDYFTEHRMHQPHRGWKSLGIHGLRAALTQGYEVYGYADDRVAPYDWTWVSKRCPVTTEWLKSLREYGRWHRVRFMLLEPLGYINLHRDRQTHALGPVNVALNMPQGCQFTMEGYGAVPFKAGDAFAVDIGNVHTVVNNSLERRYHMILHGEHNQAYAEMLYRSAKLHVHAVG